jgi:hypothetical protein
MGVIMTAARRGVMCAVVPAFGLMIHVHRLERAWSCAERRMPLRAAMRVGERAGDDLRDGRE